MGSSRYWFGLQNYGMNSVKVINVVYDDYDYEAGASPKKVIGWKLDESGSRKEFLEVNNAANGAAFTVVIRINNLWNLSVRVDPRAGTGSVEGKLDDNYQVFFDTPKDWGDHGALRCLIASMGTGSLAANGDLEGSKYRDWQAQLSKDHYAHDFFMNVIPVARNPPDDRAEGGFESYNVLRNANLKFAAFLADTIAWEVDKLHLSDNFFKALPRPKGADPQLYKDDAWFANFVLRGPDPTTLERASSAVTFPSSFVAAMQQSNQYDAFQHDVASKNIFFVDYRPYAHLASQGRFASWPFALFRARTGGPMEPVAISLVTPASQGSEITVFAGQNHPACSWELAKRIFLSAAANYHELGTHLGRTHLVMERYALATYRQLPPWHPVGRLLRPHFKYMVATNNEAFKALINPGGPVDGAFMAHVDQLDQIAVSAFSSWDLGVHGGISSDLERRGLLDDTALPFWPYKDYGTKIYAAIHRFVRSYLQLWYAADGKVYSADSALKNWRRALREDYRAQSLMGEDASFEELVTACANIIWTSGPQHSAVNYSQYDFLADGHTLPFCIQETPNGMFEPSRDQLGSQAEVIARLSLYQFDKLGEYSNKSFLSEYGDLGDPKQPWSKCIASFRNTLADLALKQRAQAGHDWQLWDYPFLNPDLIANGISI